MKFILSILAFFVSCCSAETDQKIMRLEFNKDMQLILFENGKEISRKSITLEGQIKDDLETWLTTVNLDNEDINSYAPSIILLGKKIKVNFQKNKTIISAKENDDPKGVWKQYSRNPTEQDRKMRSLLVKLYSK